MKFTYDVEGLIVGEDRVGGPGKVLELFQAYTCYVPPEEAWYLDEFRARFDLATDTHTHTYREGWDAHEHSRPNTTNERANKQRTLGQCLRMNPSASKWSSSADQ